MARNKTPKFAWRSFFAAAGSGHDIWTIISKAIEVAAEDDVSELRKRRDSIVEQLYGMTAIPGVRETESKNVQDRAGVEASDSLEGAADDGVSTLPACAELIASDTKPSLLSNGAQLERKPEQKQSDGQSKKKPSEGQKHHEKVSLLGANREESGAPSRRVGFADEAELQAVIEEDSLRMQDILQSRTKLSAPNRSEEELLKAMALLDRMNITVEELKATEIGKTVSALRKHPARAVQSVAKQLVKSWKDLVEDFQAVTDEISKKSSTGPSTEGGGLEAPPLDVATLASRNTSAELSQLLEDFTAEDLAAGLEKLSSTGAPGSDTDDAKLAFLSPVYDPRPASRDGLDPLTTSAPSAQAPGKLCMGKEARDKVAAEKWHQSARPNGVPLGDNGKGGLSSVTGAPERVGTPEASGKAGAAGGKPERRNGVLASGETLKRLRSLEDDDDIFGEGREKKARLGEAGPNKEADAPRRESLGAETRTDVKTASNRRGPSPELGGQPPRSSAGARAAPESGRSKQPGALQSLGAPKSPANGRRLGTSVERPRSRTPEPAPKSDRPSLSPAQRPASAHQSDSQKPLAKPRSASNFLQFNDTAKRATAPPRRNPEMRDPPPRALSGVEHSAQGAVSIEDGHANREKGRDSRQLQTGGVSDDNSKAARVAGRADLSDDDLFDELEALPRVKKQSGPSPSGAPAAGGRKDGKKADVSRSRAPASANSDSEPETGLEEEDGFLSDSDEELDVVPTAMEPADKLEETKRRLHEKYLQAENAKRSRTTVELKAGDLPARRKMLAHSDKGKARSGMHSKLAKLSRR